MRDCDKMKILAFVIIGVFFKSDAHIYYLITYILFD